MLRDSTETIHLEVNNSIEMQDDIQLAEQGKGKKFTSRFLEAGVAHYREFGDVLIKKETIDKFLPSIIGCPVIIRHKDITAENVDRERVGVVSNAWYDAQSGWYCCDGIIWDAQAIDLVKNHGWNVSCTYDFESDKKPLVHNGKEIAMEFTGGNFLHLALVDNPRYEDANIVMNAKDGEEGYWITVDDHPVLIKHKGLAAVLQDNYKSVAHFAGRIRLYASGNKQDEALQKEVAEIQERIAPFREIEREREQEANQKAEADGRYQANKKKLEELAGNGYEVLSVDKKGLYWTIVHVRPEDIEGIVTRIDKQHGFFTAKKSQREDGILDVMIFPKKEGESKVIQNEEDGKWITIKGTHVFIPKGKNVEDVVKEKFGEDASKENKPAQKEEKDSLKGKYSKEDADFDEAQVKKDIASAKEKGYKTIEEISDYLGLDEDEVRDFETPSEKEEHKFDEADFEKWSKEKKANNSIGDLTMTVLDDLKNFIKDVVANESDKEEEKKVDNEDVKAEDEVIEEKDEKKEAEDKEEKAENKCKNEDEKKEADEKADKEEKVENEDEEKVEDKHNEEDKADNKCENSMDDMRNIVFDATNKTKTTYISSAERLELGNKY